MRVLRTLVLCLVLAGTMAGCVVYDGPYPGRRYYHFRDGDDFHGHHDCWHCGRW